MNKHYIVLILFLIPFLSSKPQNFNSNNVAKVGNLTISNDEFLERYEMTPGLNRHRKSTTESQKIEFLFSLIAEKLWALEAQTLHLDTTEVIKFSTLTFEKMFVRDLFFKKEIKEKIIITNDEISEGLKRNNNKLYVNFLFSTDQEEIYNLHSLLTAGIPFDTILAESPEMNEQIEPIEVVFGQMDEAVEDLLYQLKLNEFTKPILTTDGWYIFYLINKSEQILSGTNAREDAEKNVRKIIEARRLIEYQKEFFVKFFKDKKVDVDPALFETLAKNISSLFEYKKKNYFIKDGDLINLEPADILKMEEVFGDDLLSKPFILLEKKHISFKDYLRTLIFDGYNATEYKLNFIRASLDNRIRKDIERELVYREGLNRGYNNLPEVKNEIQTWRLNYLFNALKDKFRDSVSISNEEVYNYYITNNQPESYPMLVNIVEILVDNLDTVEVIFAELKSGFDFNELAKKYNKREWTKKSNGEYGLFPISQHGEIGKIASTMIIGDIYGPLKLGEGYSIFKLIDKLDEKVIPPKPFEKFEAQYKQELTNRKLYSKITEYTYQLAIKYGVNIDADVLENIKVTSLPSFGIRYLGFGGKMTAVPIIAPNVDWAEKWIRHQQQTQVNP
jgi:peptidyl-prolyl cis-trans isomerase C